MPVKKTTNKSSSTISNKQAPSAPAKKKSKAWIWILVSCLSLLIIAIISFIIFGVIIFKVFSAPTQPADEQLKLIRENKLVQAYDLGSAEFKKVTSREDFERFINEHPEIKDSKKTNFTSTDIKDNVAIIKGTIENDGNEIPIEYRMVKEKGQWKIYLFTLNPENSD